MASLEKHLNSACGKAVIESSEDLKALLNKLDQNGMVAKARAKKASKKASGWDMAFEIYVNNILSRPTTQVLNIASNLVPIFTRNFESLASVSASKMFASESDKLSYYEVAAEMGGLVDGFREAFTFLGHRLAGIHMTNEQLMDMHKLPRELAQQAKIEREHQALHSRNVNWDSQWMKKALDWYGFAQNIPGRFLTNADLFFKIINYRAEVSKQSMRQAIQDAKASGVTDFRQLYDANKKLALDGYNVDIIDKGIRNADEMTYTNRPNTRLDRWLAEKGHDDVPGLRWIVPFRRTLVNVISYGIGRSPLSPALAVLGTKIDAFKSPTYHALFRGSSAERMDAIGRIAAGSAMMSALYAVLSDGLDGEAPREATARQLWMDNGHKEYSVRIGNMIIPMENFGGYGVALKALARYKQLASNVDYEDPEERGMLEDMTNTLLIAMGDTLLSEHWGSSMLRFFRAIDQAERQEDLGPILNFITYQGVNAVPIIGAGALTQQVTQRIDPYKRDINTASLQSPIETGNKTLDEMLELANKAFQPFIARTPFWSKTLEAKIGLWGDPMRYDNWLDPNLASPLTGEDEVANLLRNLRVTIPTIPRIGYAPDKHNVVRFTREEYQYLHIVRGKGVPEWGIPPLRDRLITEIQSPLFSQYETDIGRAEHLAAVIKEYQGIARSALEMHPHFTYGQRKMAAELKHHQERSIR